MKQFKQVYIGEDFTLSNGSILNRYDVCTFHIVKESQMYCEVFNDMTGENLGFTYFSEKSKWFIPLAEWRDRQIDKILEDD
jgi:hypothetical protein